MTDDARLCLAHGANPYPARLAEHVASAGMTGAPRPGFGATAAEDDA
jgi:hypothetical protein